jgi:tRNA threonylcarbamoyladenosine biosynthesis protein TsaE
VTPRQLVLRTESPDDTRKVAATIADALRPGDVIALTGELGAGKTCFVQGAAAALGVTERVTSPSFVLRRDYAGTIPVLHLDVYRLDTLREVAELDYEEIGSKAGVALIEWGDAMSPLLPASHLEVELRVEPAEESEPGLEPRRIVLRPRGDDWLRRVPVLAAHLQHWMTEDREG